LEFCLIGKIEKTPGRIRMMRRNENLAEPATTGNAGRGPVLFVRAGGPAFLT
jgi:hypothetical protein